MAPDKATKHRLTLIAYIAEEVGDCQISDTKSFIFNKKTAYFNTKNAYF